MVGCSITPRRPEARNAASPASTPLPCGSGQRVNLRVLPSSTSVADAGAAATIAAVCRACAQETTTPHVYKNQEYPEISVDVNLNSHKGGPFEIFIGNRSIGVYRALPTAQQLGLRWGLTDKPKPEMGPAADDWL